MGRRRDRPRRSATRCSRAAATCGIAAESASYRLLELWTLERPAREIVCGLARVHRGDRKVAHASASATALRAKVIGRAWAVASAAGGFLDATPSVSPEEHAALDALDAAFGAADR